MPPTAKHLPRSATWGAGLVLAVPFALLALLPWSKGPGPYSVPGSVVLGAVAIALIWRARPGRPGDNAASRPLAGQAVRVRLTHCVLPTGRGDRSYAVEIEQEGVRGILLAGEDPAETLQSAFEHAKKAGTKLEPGWGLDTTDLDALTAAPTAGDAIARPLLLRLRAPRFRAARAASITLVIVSLFAFAIVVIGTTVHQGTVSTTSAVLAMLAVLLPLGVAGASAMTTTLEAAEDRVVFLRTALGWQREEAAFATKDIQHVCAVSPDGRYHKHLLLRTAHGIRGIPCADAQRVAAAIHEGWKHPGRRTGN